MENIWRTATLTRQDQKDEKQKIRLKTIFALQIASTHNHTNYEILVAYSLQ